MKHPRIRSFLLSFLLSLAVGLGSMGCLVTAFDLPMAHMGRVLLICAAVSGLGSFLFSRRNGELAVLCLLAAAVGFLWYGAVFPRQVTTLIVRIGNRLDEAYHWGGFVVPDNPPYVDYPMAALAVLLIVLVCRSVSGRKSTAAPVFFGLLCLLGCMVCPDTDPAVLPLGSLLAGLALLVLTGSVRRESGAQGSRLTIAAALPVLLLTAVLLAAVPSGGCAGQSGSLRTALLARLQRVPGVVSEEGGILLPVSSQPLRPRVDLAALGSQDNQSIPVMAVRTARAETLYLRGQDYDVYTRTGWESSPGREEEFSGWGSGGEQITLRTFSPHELLYLPYFPEGSTLLSDGMAANTEHLQEYTLTRCPMGSMADPDTLSRCLALPEDTKQSLKAYLPQQGPDIQSTAARIANLVRMSAPYSLNTGKMPESESDFVVWFLEQGETGYCVHFASAAAALLRAAGIPARYVTGYKVETLSGEEVTVTSREAHAWAEYYDSQQGCWQILEATPGITETVSAVDTMPIPTETLPAASSDAEPIPTAAPVPVPESRSGLPLGGILLLLCAGALVILQRHIRLFLRRRLQQRGAVNRQALKLWQEAEVFARLLKEPPPEQLQTLAEKALFSQHDLTPEELAPFREYRSRSRRRLKKAPWYRRLVYRYIYAVC